MRIQLSQASHKGTAPWRERLYSTVMKRMTARSDSHEPPTESEKQLVCTGFILGLFSIFAAFFPICGLPIAVVSLIMGMVGRRIAALHKMATWAMAFAIIGSSLALINVLISVSIYLSNSLWR